MKRYIFAFAISLIGSVNIHGMSRHVNDTIDNFVRAMSATNCSSYGPQFAHIVQIKDKSKLEKALEENKSILFEQDLEGYSLLVYAIGYGNELLISELLKNHSDIVAIHDFLDNSVLYYIAKNNKIQALKQIKSNDKVEKLLNKKNDKGYTPLHEAVIQGHTEIVTILLEQPTIDPFAQDNDGNDALTLAMNNKNYELARAILGTLSTERKKGWPYLYNCLLIEDGKRYWDKNSLKKQLEQEQYEITLKDPMNAGALHWIVRCGSLDLMKIVLAISNLDVNAQDNFGNTPLHYAIMNKRFDKASLLIHHGSDVKIKNNEDKTPWDLSSIFFYLNSSFRAFSRKINIRDRWFQAVYCNNGRMISNLASELDISEKNHEGKNALQIVLENEDHLQAFYALHVLDSRNKKLYNSLTTQEQEKYQRAFNAYTNKYSLPCQMATNNTQKTTSDSEKTDWIDELLESLHI